MPLNRRELVGAAMAPTPPVPLAAKSAYPAKPKTGPSMDDLARAAARPVLRREQFKDPVIIQSMELLRADKEYFVRVRSTDSAEGISVCNPPRADYLDRIFNNLVAPVFLKKDARGLE